MVNRLTTTEKSRLARYESWSWDAGVMACARLGACSVGE